MPPKMNVYEEKKKQEKEDKRQALIRFAE